MTEFELYIMIFYTLDYYWDEHKGEELGLFLSGMNPFLFEGEGSAVPDYYSNYQEIIDGRYITIENSFDLANEYISKLNKDYIAEAFSWVKKNEWMGKCEQLLAKEYNKKSSAKPAST